MNSILSHVTKGEAVDFNYKSGFYDKELNIKLKLNNAIPKDAKIYYTLDGDDPTIENDEYKDKILLNLEDVPRVYSLKVRFFYKNEYSEVYQQTYVIGKNIKNTFTLPIISITSDSHNLYDYNYGIMVPGYWYDKNKETTPQGQFIRGNYSNGWTRPAKIVLFGTDGSIYLNQDIGLSISGRTSVALAVKSFFIRANYNSDEKFKLNYINEDTDKSKVSLNNRYNTLKLRAGGQDSYKSNIRASVANRLALESNFYGGTTSDRVIMYLNGEFYGIMDMQEPSSNSVLAKKFSLEDSSKVSKIEGGEKYNFTTAGIYDLFNQDLNNIENKNKLEENVDMDNMILYYSIEILMNNFDWLQSNYDIWKYTGEYDPNNKYTDGKFRFLLFDSDSIFYSPIDFKKDKFQLMTSENPGFYNDSVFFDILKYKEYHDKFITVMTDLLNTSFDKENIYKIVDEEYSKVSVENKRYISTKRNERFDQAIKEIKEGIDYVDYNIPEHMASYFGLSEKYHLNIKTTDGIKVYWNNMEFYANEKYENDYYKGVDIKFNYEEYPGYEFDYWLVNENKIYDKELLVNENLIKDNKVNIKLVAKKTDKQKLIISEVNAKDDSDWIKLTNISNEKVSLNNYYMSDNNKKLLKYQLPDIVLNPGETIIINGNKNYYSLGDYICNFNLSSGEILYLYDYSQKEVVDRLAILRMSNMETYGRYENSNTRIFFNNINNIRKISDY